jgi:type I site-specific restriction-modification system R (restriction) subunit
MTSDRDAILICLTGTPIIGEFASKKIFGDYFHKYYYNASIADGYTLRLIREEIETSYKSSLSEVLAQFEIQKGELDKSTVFAHKNFVSPMLEYILVDLQRSRMLHSDQSIGGMVVCDSSDQAREMHSQFEEKFKDSKLMSSALILYDAGTKDDRKDFVEEFKKGAVDVLFVYNMLLTGFDAPRLKKLYMGRLVRDHNLLQALTRVNRPYKDFRFGYIVDFADISKEFEITNAAYFAELSQELGTDMSNYSNLFVSEEEILNTVNQIRTDLFLYNLENAEEFSKQISLIRDKKVMRSIIASLESGRNLYNLIRLMNFEDLMSVLDFKKINMANVAISGMQSALYPLFMAAFHKLTMINHSSLSKMMPSIFSEKVVLTSSGKSVLEVTSTISDTILSNISYGSRYLTYVVLLTLFKRYFKNNNILTVEDIKKRLKPAVIDNLVAEADAVLKSQVKLQEIIKKPEFKKSMQHIDSLPPVMQLIALDAYEPSPEASKAIQNLISSDNGLKKLAQIPIPPHLPGNQIKGIMDNMLIQASALPKVSGKNTSDAQKTNKNLSQALAFNSIYLIENKKSSALGPYIFNASQASIKKSNSSELAFS